MAAENELSREMQWFTEALRTEFGVEISATDIGYEAVELGIEEVADFFVPSELFEELPDSFLYETMIIDDENGNVWVGAIAFYPDSPDWCLQVVTKNDELVLRNTLPKPDENSRQN